MDDSVKIILKKLDDIDGRLSRLEGPNPTYEVKSGATRQSKPVEKDPLFGKALEMLDKVDEISAKQLADGLKIDQKRAEKIMDQMEASGLGTCYTKEA